MRIHLTAAILLGLLAGCSSDQSSSDGKTTAAAHSALRSQPGLPLAARSTMSSFASLPDRGELLAYRQDGKVKHRGAYNAYPVAISEAHALHAMQSGEMVVKAPNGELIRLKYKSHVESPDGNWSWIGTNADGVDAILTFGEKAVFGTIPQGTNETLRLTMNAGQSWLVQTDRSKLAGLDGAKGTRGPDLFVPPKLASASGAMSVASMRAESATANAAASTSVIDVLLGYTPGFASQLGGQSQALTRLNNIVVITNQAYLNSGITMRVRLVKAMQVSYADNTDNGDALEKLSGYTSGDSGGPITPDPAFNELRAARNESGADLVSLVRAFRTPENNGCGIAWLIGGEEAGISAADAPFGYSVVSDGTDMDEGDDNTYFCRDETLAHEMGHNMGQAHNAEDSTSTGIHPYSYGYREASSTGFYTVMAYPLADGDQFGIPYFANPNVKYSNRATGVANTSDNVRSMNQTMPIVSTFRATVTPVFMRLRDDLNGDGKSDLLWHNFSKKQAQGWRMNGAKVTYAPVNAITSYRSSGLGDFNGDEMADVIWVNTSKTEVWLWQGKTDGKYTSKRIRAYPTGWNLIAIGDSNGDGRDDLFWHNPTTGKVQVWRMNAATIDYGPVSTIGAYTAAAVGDFNGDGRVDLIWIDNAKTKVWEWQTKADGTFTSVLVRSFPGGGWSLVGAGDANADGTSDLFWHNPSTTRLQVWRMNGVAITYGPVNTISGYTAGAVGDFNGDGYADVVWYSNAKTQVWVWLAKTNGTYTPSLIRSYPTGWTLLNRRPFF
jgi:reprolysin-like metallo-peptidase family M12B/VCBS repeat protein/FG-GAP repeat protein